LEVPSVEGSSHVDLGGKGGGRSGCSVWARLVTRGGRHEGSARVLACLTPPILHRGGLDHHGGSRHHVSVHQGGHG